MLKTISHDEFVHLKKIMKNYYYHMLAYPHTLITRFLGLHKIKFTRTTRTERVYFVIMCNVFNTSQEIDIRYDLKGSTAGRITRKDPTKKYSSTVTLKDLDWLNDAHRLKIRPEQRNLLL
jgi:1-phosphatidylinositol-4-phosphate 5-kinase